MAEWFTPCAGIRPVCCTYTCVLKMSLHKKERDSPGPWSQLVDIWGLVDSITRGGGREGQRYAVLARGTDKAARDVLDLPASSGAEEFPAHFPRYISRVLL